MAKKKLPKWTDIYPQGTKEGDEEQKFFISLARNPKWSWRSLAQLSKETGISKERLEQIIKKYEKKGMVIQSPTNDSNWGYWERNLDQVPDEPTSISQTDQNKRMKKVAKNIIHDEDKS